MLKIDTKVTREFTKDLTVLYVEDDQIIQKQTHKFLNLLFKSVEVANDGLEALHKYQDKDFDIIITDIVMPNMNGLELSKKIKELNPNQHIIVTSAYNDSEQLIEFINLHIRQFMLKPVEINNMLLTLYNVSKSIVDHKRIEECIIKIEKHNHELRAKNNQLLNIAKILDIKLMQLSMNSTDKNNNLSNLDTDDLSELKELEEDIIGTIKVIKLSQNIKTHTVDILSNLFYKYYDILSKYDDYTELSTQIKQLADILTNKKDDFIKKFHEISILLDSLSYVLKLYSNSLKDKNVQKAFQLHTSIINDIKAIISIIKN